MKLSNTSLRVVTSIAMLAVLALVFVLEMYFPKIHVVRWVSMLIVLGGIVETIMCFYRTTAEDFQKHSGVFTLFVMWLIIVLFSTYFVGSRPWIMLCLLMIIVGADTGAWLFGKTFGGDKMWEKISEHKTWSGQIGGILCGTAMALLYGFIGTDSFRPELIWTGISVALLSQYGDLTASFIKRCLGIKDFGKLLPGHGGILDRFDGWIYVLPLAWLIIR
ncbi:MAG: phosphatidate cytidylyltransferase [Alphaproteobacteria bacterium]|nr:phosphatidate cytidylyltransferase [Alphaproteobacteria bacterium]